MPIPSRKAIAAVLLAAALLAAALQVSRTHFGTAPAPGPLSALIGDNGLYVSGETYSGYLAQISVPDTVYDDLTIAAAGKPVPAMYRTAGSTEALDSFTAADPIWGWWFISAAYRSTGAAVPAGAARALEPLFHDNGYWAEAGQQPDDAAGNVATTWAALEIDSAVSPAVRVRVLDWLSQQSTHISYPIEACQLAQSYQALGEPVPPQVVRYAGSWLSSHPTTFVSSMADLADIDGATCAAAAAGAIPASIRSSLSVAAVGAFTRTTTGLERYDLAQIWMSLGGDRSQMAPLAALSLADLNGRGVARGQTTLTGGLQPTYFAITTQKADTGYIDTNRAPFIEKALAATDPAADPLDYLAGSAALCVVGACGSVSQTGLQEAIARLPTTIDITNISAFAIARRYLQALGRAYPPVIFRQFDTSTVVGRYALITATAAYPNGASGLDQPLPSSLLNRDIETLRLPLTDPSTLSEALDILAARGDLTSQAKTSARRYLMKLSDCGGLPALYSTADDQTASCDLTASTDAIGSIRLLSTSHPQ